MNAVEKAIMLSVEAIWQSALKGGIGWHQVQLCLSMLQNLASVIEDNMTTEDSAYAQDIYNELNTLWWVCNQHIKFVVNG